MSSWQGKVSESHWNRLKRYFSKSFSAERIHRRRSFDVDSLDDLLDTRRRHVYRYVLLLLAVILIPLVMHSLYIGQLVPGFAGLLLLGVLGANIWILSLGRDAFLSPTLVLLMSISLVLVSLYHGQNYNLYWLYPLLVALPFLLRTRWAVMLGVLCGLVLAPLIFTSYPRGTALIIGASMGLTWLVSAWLVFAVTEQSRRLKDMAITDPLTGAYNRRFLEIQARQALLNRERNSRPAAILLLDIDHFKRINDRFGHSRGDAALKALVTLIANRIRSVDTLCRYGGEEFVLLLADTDRAAAAGVAEELRGKIEAADILPEGKMTVSIGVSDVAGVAGLDQWLNLADSALYLAKRGGRNRVELADPSALRHSAPDRNIPDWR